MSKPGNLIISESWIDGGGFNIMKILLVVPIKPKRLDFWVMPPIGLGYVARALEKKNQNVEILNCPKENFSFSDFARYLAKQSPDVLGVTMFSHDFQYVGKMLDIAKKQNNKIVTVAGGPHPSCMAKETLQYLPSLDFVVRGEGEVSTPMLIDALSSGSGFDGIPNLAWRDKSGKIIVNEQRYLDPADFLEMPAWNLMDLKNYPKTPPTLLFKKQPFAPISVTRGCPFSCTFCSAGQIHGKNIRLRNLDDVLSEIDLLYNHYGVREFYIVDDNFTANKSMVKTFCREIINRKYNIALCNPNGVRLDTLDIEMLTLMKKAGWYYLSVGIESGSQPVLEHMKKRITVSLIKEKVAQIRKAGLEVYGFFIIGYPTETLNDIKKTVNFALELDLIGANFSCFQPLPGTAIFEMLVREKKISEEEFIELFNNTYADVSYSPDSISKRTLKSIQRKSILRFYFRPKTMVKNLVYLKSGAHFKFLITRASAYLLGN